MQRDDLKRVGCRRLFTDVASGGKDRPGRAEAIRLWCGSLIGLGDRLSTSCRPSRSYASAALAFGRCTRVSTRPPAVADSSSTCSARWPSLKGTSSASAPWRGWPLRVRVVDSVAGPRCSTSSNARCFTRWRRTGTIRPRSSVPRSASHAPASTATSPNLRRRLRRPSKRGRRGRGSPRRRARIRAGSDRSHRRPSRRSGPGPTRRPRRRPGPRRARDRADDRRPTRGRARAPGRRRARGGREPGHRSGPPIASQPYPRTGNRGRARSPGSSR